MTQCQLPTDSRTHTRLYRDFFLHYRRRRRAAPLSSDMEKMLEHANDRNFHRYFRHQITNDSRHKLSIRLPGTIMHILTLFSTGSFRPNRNKIRKNRRPVAPDTDGVKKSTPVCALLLGICSTSFASLGCRTGKFLLQTRTPS